MTTGPSFNFVTCQLAPINLIPLSFFHECYTVLLIAPFHIGSFCCPPVFVSLTLSQRRSSSITHHVTIHFHRCHQYFVGQTRNERRGNVFFHPIPSHSRWFIPIPVLRISQVLFTFHSHSHWLFPFPPIPDGSFPLPIPIPELARLYSHSLPIHIGYSHSFSLPFLYCYSSISSDNK